MLKTGKKQKLQIVKKLEFGIYLAEHKDADKTEQVLLPAKEVPEEAKIGDLLEVFLYRDSEDRLISTMREPLVEVGGVALLPVKQVTKIGAFLDWGLEKDLLLPFHEQTRRVQEGEEVLAALYIDKSGRLAATMKLYPYLSTDSPYQKGDIVEGRIYENAHNFGIFVAVDDRYSAMIPKREAQGSYRPGEILKLRVTEVKADGKLTVSDRKEAYLQIEPDAKKVLEELNRRGGSLPFDDKADPSLIRDTFAMSKAAFKRAIGHLLKEKEIRIAKGRIVLLQDSRE